MKRFALLSLFAACAGSAPSPGTLDALLRNAETQSPDEACVALTDAIKSGQYSQQRWASENEVRGNREYQLARAREHYCEKAAAMPTPGSEPASQQSSPR